MPTDFHKLTPDIRAALKQRRLSLGLSYASLGKMLQASRTTVYAWENGLVSRCSELAWHRLQNFLVHASSVPVGLMQCLGAPGQTLPPDQVQGRVATLLHLAGKLRSDGALQETYHLSLKNAYKDMLALYADSL